MLTLCLTGTSLPLPPSLSAIHLKTSNTPPQTLKDAYLLLSAQQQIPSYIAFSANTPSLLLLASQQSWPEALYLLQEEQRWLELPSGEYWHIGNNAPLPSTPLPSTASQTTSPNIIQNPAAPVTPPKNNKNTPTPSSVSATTHAAKSKNDTQLLSEVFNYASWGEHTPENRAKLDNLFAELLKRSQRNSQLMQQAQQQRNLGTQAYNIAIEAERRFKRGNNPEFKAWFKQQVTNNPLIAHHLHQKLQKWQTWHAQKMQQVQSKAVCTLPQLSVSDHHPNSLRHLATHHQWHILIDETGNEFDNSKHLSINNKSLGRMVALAIPVNKVQLPTLKNNFHATHEADALLDEVIKTLLSKPVGIVGITVNDELLGTSSRWFSGIYMLMRLVLRLLPIPINEQSEITFFIEQRGSFDTEMSLFPIQQLLENELQALDANRFKNVSLNLQFANKNTHTANGYVDALANMWTAGSANSKMRLKHSALQGHCLLKPQHHVIERSYAAIDQQHSLKANEWYELVSAISNEPSSSLLHHVLHQLGQHAQQQILVWHHYLAYVNQQLQHKNYHVLALKTALDWLANYAPKECNLPPMLRLHWDMARLACANHLGQQDMSLLSQSLKLAQSLLNEDAMEVCHAHLRIAVAATNQFEFEAAQQVLDFWQAQDPRLMGLNNYGKYLSSLGQLAAFRGEQNQAISYFDQAISTFSALSDSQEKQRQQQQTHIYRLIALSDTPTVSDQALQQALESFWHKPLAQIAAQLAQTHDSQRFEQHLLVRVMVTRPALQQASYIEAIDEWQFEEAHPWPLIAAYRAVLLHKHHPLKASLWLYKAIEVCRESQGATLQWIGEVLALWGSQYGIKTAPLPSAQLQHLQDILPHAPWSSLALLKNARTPTEALSHLAHCLPFNFH